MSLQCIFYRFFIDSILRSLRGTLADLVPSGSTVLEAACGTGEQSLLLAEKASHVVGFDYNPVMVDCARRRIPEDRKNLTFLEADARSLAFISDNEFDFATISLALHEMNKDRRLPVLAELSRTARLLLISDYASPLPSTIGGRFTGMIECLAGREHYAGFRSYQKAGGMNSLLHDAGLVIQDEHRCLGGVVRILLCRQEQN